MTQTLSLREHRSSEGSTLSDVPGGSRVADAQTEGDFRPALSRRLRRLGALEMLGRAERGDGPPFRFFFASGAPPIFAYYACIGVADLPDIIDAHSEEIDFLLARPEQHADLLVAAGLLACGSCFGRISTRAAVERAREAYGNFAAWTLLRPGPVKSGAAAALPGREEAYAVGHGAYRVFAAQQQPAFDKWVDAICARPMRRVVINSLAAAAAYREARERLRCWEALDAAHKG